MRFAVVVFPGSNCDVDCYRAAHDVLGQPTEYVWHQTERLDGVDCVILPGGFSYGDYLRAGALARFSPVMGAVARHAARGGLVLGICNGFQILCEAGLLPGALRRNRGLHFACKNVFVRVENAATPFTRGLAQGQVLQLPIAHGEGNYYCDDATAAELNAARGVVFRYCDADGRLSDAANPNGSREHIAGIVNAKGNVLGMMPHPERNAERLLGTADGRLVFDAIVAGALQAKEASHGA